MKISIRWVVILGCFILIWGSHLVITPFSLYSNQKVMQDHSRDIMANILDLSLEQTRNYFSVAGGAAELTKRLIAAQVVHLDHGDLKELEKYFLEKMQIYPQFAGIYFANPQGCFYFVNREGSGDGQKLRTKIIHRQGERRTVTLTWRNRDMEILRTLPSPTDTFDPRQRPWYIKAVREKTIIWTEPYVFFSSRKPGITTAVPLMDEAGTLLGVVGVDIELEALSNFIGNLKVGKSGAAFMLNPGRDVIASPDQAALSHTHLPREDLRLPKLHELSNPLCMKAFEAAEPELTRKTPPLGGRPVFAKFEHGDKTYFAMFTRVQAAKSKWLIGVYIPEEDYFGEILANSHQTLLITLVVSILATIGGLFLARHITDPISQLDEQARKIKDNEEDQAPLIHSVFTQIQHTADSFYDMRKAIRIYKQKLQHKERIHRTILDTANEAIFMVDDHGIIQYWNTAAENLFGYRADQVTGTRVFTLSPFIPGKAPWKMDLNALLTRRNAEPRIRNRRLTLKSHQGEDVPTEVSMVRIRMEETQYTIAVIRDISLRIREEEEKLSILRQLEQAQKIESIGTLAGGIAHDFNNILTSIIGNTELLKANLAEDPRNRPLLDSISLAGDRARELVRQILAFSHQDTRKEERLYLDTIVRDACSLVSASVPPAVQIREEIAQGCPPVFGDPAQIHQVALNLLTNAFQAMETTGGTLKVSLKQETLTRNEGEINPNPGPGRYLCYGVSDTGVGIEPHLMDKIFDPYFTTKTPGKGTGLGLAVIKGIVEHHGGGIHVSSTPGQGTTFKVYLPVARQTGQAAHRAGTPGEIIRGSEHILLVDDQQQVLNIQRQILEFLGYRITDRNSAEDALTAFKAHPHHFDLVITDFSMHPVNGMELTRELQKLRPDLPIILCTGYNDGIDREEILGAGVRAIVTKPIKVKHYSGAIRQCLETSEKRPAP